MSTFVRLEIGSVHNDHWPTMKFPELRSRQITEISSDKPGQFPGMACDLTWMKRIWSYTILTIAVENEQQT